ncbi:plasmid pRiA4b ORF-3 family protein [Planctomycetales bacterium ZRK34]|nr:plasmid pRiA4b ORF-3 family protein [Planctomycetales bacterium ZRK34]
MNGIFVMTIYQLRVSLKYTKPPIWRRVAVPSNITLGQLHEIIQIAMGWTNSHLHQFILRDKSLKPTRDEMRRVDLDEPLGDVFINRMRGERVFAPATTPFGDPMDMEGEDEDEVLLEEVCPKVKGKLIYEYDFGDGWEHTVEVQKVEPAKSKVDYPVCLAGKLACPPEDCGGVFGYYHLLEVLADPKHEEYEDLVEWMGDDIDPEVFDIEEINAMLAEWRG